MPTFQKVKWEQKTLSQLGFIGRGKSKHRPRNDACLYGGKYPFIQTSDIKHTNFYVNSYFQTYNEVGLKQSKLWDKDTLCMTIAANIAETALLSFPACFPDSIVGFVADPEKSNVKFVKYALDFAKKNYQSTAQGTAQDNLSLEKIDTLKIAVPDPKTQTRIATVLSAYDDLIENNEKRIKALEEMAQLLYTEWFVKFKFPGSAYAKASADKHEKVKMVDSGTEYGMVPEGWNVGKISDFANVISGFPFKGSTYLESGKYKIVTIKNVHDGKFVLNFDSFINELPLKLPKACILKSGDILLSLTGNVGRICIAYGLNNLLNQRVAKLEPIDVNNREYIYFLFRQKSFQQKLEAMSNGAAQQNLSPIQVKDIKVIIPKLEILDKFSQIASKYYDLSLYLQEKNQNLSKTRDLLIPQLVTGRRELK